ncbi:MAG: chemotaxis protein CheC [Clostridiales bacterium]|nr:chemotaxis protein CheC [Clostridiales bacterium]
MHIDALREIGNIGSGNAASALSTMLCCPVNISVPTVQVLDYNDAVEQMGGPEQMIVGSLISLEGDVQGMILFLLQKNFSSMMIKTLLCAEEAPEVESIDEMGYSVIQEVANIMAASYLNAIGSLTGLTIGMSTPSLCIDMLGAILSVPAIYYANISDKIIYIQDEFSGHDFRAPSHILLIPDMDSLKNIMGKLGLEVE